ncbi:uncharacterized protein PAC_04924 [Phialocephala subalpina]|uniref:Uncharacterized protein n=1 Tax=Phialocephala subalpina TaxID=576137 RepID=A0A1L7WQJ7_9HELO|nr:uncharacterized protein PAC_04924 [Phialocephala subalpina]
MPPKRSVAVEGGDKAGSQAAELSQGAAVLSHTLDAELHRQSPTPGHQLTQEVNQHISEDDESPTPHQSFGGNDVWNNNPTGSFIGGQPQSGAIDYGMGVGGYMMGMYEQALPAYSFGPGAPAAGAGDIGYWMGLQAMDSLTESYGSEVPSPSVGMGGVGYMMGVHEQDHQLQGFGSGVPAETGPFANQGSSSLPTLQQQAVQLNTYQRQNSNDGVQGQSTTAPRHRLQNSGNASQANSHQRKTSNGNSRGQQQQIPTPRDVAGMKAPRTAASSPPRELDPQGDVSMADTSAFAAQAQRYPKEPTPRDIAAMKRPRVSASKPTPALDAEGDVPMSMTDAPTPRPQPYPRAPGQLHSSPPESQLLNQNPGLMQSSPLQSRSYDSPNQAQGPWRGSEIESQFPHGAGLGSSQMQSGPPVGSHREPGQLHSNPPEMKLARARGQSFNQSDPPQMGSLGSSSQGPRSGPLMPPSPLGFPPVNFPVNLHFRATTTLVSLEPQRLGQMHSSIPGLPHGPGSQTTHHDQLGGMNSSLGYHGTESAQMHPAIRRRPSTAGLSHPYMPPQGLGLDLDQIRSRSRGFPPGGENHMSNRYNPSGLHMPSQGPGPEQRQMNSGVQGHPPGYSSSQLNSMAGQFSALDAHVDRLLAQSNAGYQVNSQRHVPGYVPQGFSLQMVDPQSRTQLQSSIANLRNFSSSIPSMEPSTNINARVQSSEAVSRPSSLNMQDQQRPMNQDDRTHRSMGNPGSVPGCNPNEQSSINAPARARKLSEVFKGSALQIPPPQGSMNQTNQAQRSGARAGSLSFGLQPPEPSMNPMTKDSQSMKRIAQMNAAMRRATSRAEYSPDMSSPQLSMGPPQDPTTRDRRLDITAGSLPSGTLMTSQQLSPTGELDTNLIPTGHSMTAPSRLDLARITIGLPQHEIDRPMPSPRIQTSINRGKTSSNPEILKRGKSDARRENKSDGEKQRADFSPLARQGIIPQDLADLSTPELQKLAAKAAGIATAEGRELLPNPSTEHLLQMVQAVQQYRTEVVNAPIRDIPPVDAANPPVSFIFTAQPQVTRSNASQTGKTDPVANFYNNVYTDDDGPRGIGLRLDQVENRANNPHPMNPLLQRRRIARMEPMGQILEMTESIVDNLEIDIQAAEERTTEENLRAQQAQAVQQETVATAADQEERRTKELAEQILLSLDGGQFHWEMNLGMTIPDPPGFMPITQPIGPMSFPEESDRYDPRAQRRLEEKFREEMFSQKSFASTMRNFQDGRKADAQIPPEPVDNAQPQASQYHTLAIAKIPRATQGRHDLGSDSMFRVGEAFNTAFILREMADIHKNQCTFCVYNCDYGVCDASVFLPVSAGNGYCQHCHSSTMSATIALKDVTSSDKSQDGYEVVGGFLEKSNKLQMDPLFESAIEELTEAESVAHAKKVQEQKAKSEKYKTDTAVPPLKQLAETNQYRKQASQFLNHPERLADLKNVYPKSAFQAAMGAVPKKRAYQATVEGEEDDDTAPRVLTKEDLGPNIRQYGTAESLAKSMDVSMSNSDEVPVSNDLDLQEALVQSYQDQQTPSLGTPSTRQRRSYSLITGEDPKIINSAMFCRGCLSTQVDVLLAKICDGCRHEKLTIAQHRHVGFMLLSEDSSRRGADGILLEPSVLARNCMVCTKLAMYKCEGCSLRVCEVCQTLLQLTCGGWMNELLYHYAVRRFHIRNDAFLLRADGKGY